MCGIAGILNTKGWPVFETTLRRMVEVMAYRGPDGAPVPMKG